MKKMKLYYILGGPSGREPISVEDVLEWAKFFEVGDKRRVAMTHLGSLSVSTVFLGIDHGFAFDKEARPVLFETMVFGEDCELAGIEQRYCTWEEAEAGHAIMVRRVQLWQSPSARFWRCVKRLFCCRS